LVEAWRYQVQNDGGSLATATALNSRFKIDHSKLALAQLAVSCREGAASQLNALAP
jgi:hypothetical protein